MNESVPTRSEAVDLDPPLEHATFWTDEGIESPDDVIAEIGARHLPIGATAGLAPAPDFLLDEATSARLPAIIANVFRLRDTSARIVPGTDAGINPAKPHDVVRYAVEQEVLFGMSADETLRSATAVPWRGSGPTSVVSHRRHRPAPCRDHVTA